MRSLQKIVMPHKFSFFRAAVVPVSPKHSKRLAALNTCLLSKPLTFISYPCFLIILLSF